MTQRPGAKRGPGPGHREQSRRAAAPDPQQTRSHLAPPQQQMARNHLVRPGGLANTQPVPKPVPGREGSRALVGPAPALGCLHVSTPNGGGALRDGLQVTRTVVQVEQKAAHVFIVHFPSSVCFVLRNNLQREAEEKIALD